jgi:hypothetical protein
MMEEVGLLTSGLQGEIVGKGGFLPCGLLSPCKQTKSLQRL